MQLRGQAHAVLAARGLAEECEPGRGVDDRAHRPPEQRLVIDAHRADRERGQYGNSANALGTSITFDAHTRMAGFVAKRRKRRTRCGLVAAVPPTPTTSG